MASKEQIKAAILKVAGNPETGPVFQLADAMAEAVVGLDAPAKAEYAVMNAQAKRLLGKSFSEDITNNQFI